jgi:hypothetical protein
VPDLAFSLGGGDGFGLPLLTCSGGSGPRNNPAGTDQIPVETVQTILLPAAVLLPASALGGLGGCCVRRAGPRVAGARPCQVIFFGAVILLGLETVGPLPTPVKPHGTGGVRLAAGGVSVRPPDVGLR